jgi:hypothetical protein
MGKLYKLKKNYLDKLSPMGSTTRAILGDKKMDEITETTHPLGVQAETAYDAKRASEKALKDAEENPEPVVPLPDEEELDRVRRRRNARRSGGRASTVLSDDSRLGG